MENGDKRKYIDEISDFIWDKISRYYQEQQSSIAQYAETTQELSRSFESNAELEKWKKEYNSLKHDYDDLSELYETAKTTMETKLKNVNADYSTEQLNNKLLKNELRANEHQLKQLMEYLNSIKEEHNVFVASLKNDYNKQIDYMKKSVEEATTDKKQLLTLFNEHVEQQVAQRIETYKTQNEDLKRENEYYYNLYVDKSKGKFYETELYPRLLEYNTKHMGGQWHIEHVGSTTSEKCDFVFKHKDNDATILLDTKNNIQSQSVNNIDMDKFLRDVSLGDNKAIGGILLANSRICNKKEFEVNEHQGRTLVFISNYNQDNVGFVFSLLDLIYSKYKEDQKDIDVSRVKQGTIDDIKFLKERSNIINNEKRKIESYLVSLENRFITLYGQNIDEWVNSIKKTTNIDKNDINNKEIIDFDEIEKNRTIIGKRTKYYLCYDDPVSKEPKIQYFQNNSRKKSKMEKLSSN